MPEQVNSIETLLTQLIKRFNCLHDYDIHKYNAVVIT